jgi:large subunit ribosomal protein L22
MYVKTISVDQGPALKRFIPRAQGRASKIRKPTSHVQIVLDEI